MLEVSAIDTFYGETQALFGVSLSVRAGQVLALLGANGAGKTTVLRSILGLTRPRRGDIAFEAVHRHAPTHEIAQAGIGWVPDDRRLPDADRRQEPRPWPQAQQVPSWTLEEVTEIFTPLKYLMGREAETLSGGEMQMVAIARRCRAPGLVLLDEPSQGLAPKSSTMCWASFAA